MGGFGISDADVVGVKGVELAAVRIALDCNIKATYDWIGSVLYGIGQQDQTGAGPKYWIKSFNIFLERMQKTAGSCKPVHDSRFAAWDDETMQAVQVLRLLDMSHINGDDIKFTQSIQCINMLLECAL